MPACMMLPLECPSSSPVTPSDTSSSSSGVSDDEGSPAPQESEERLSPGPWPERRGEGRQGGGAPVLHERGRETSERVASLSCDVKLGFNGELRQDEDVFISVIRLDLLGLVEDKIMYFRVVVNLK